MGIPCRTIVRPTRQGHVLRDARMGISMCPGEFREGKSAVKKGTGLSNIKAVAEKYSGAMSIETKEDAFVLQVLLVIPQQPECISRQMD